jgi:hypothetical protein
MRAKNIERLLRLSFYRNKAYNVSLELGLFKSIPRPRLRPTQRQSTAIATTITPRSRSNVVGAFSIQPFKVLQEEGPFKDI